MDFIPSLCSKSYGYYPIVEIRIQQCLSGKQAKNNPTHSDLRACVFTNVVFVKIVYVILWYPGFYIMFDNFWISLTLFFSALLINNCCTTNYIYLVHTICWVRHAYTRDTSITIKTMNISSPPKISLYPFVFVFFVVRTINTR